MPRLDTVYYNCHDGAECHVTPDKCAANGSKKRGKGVHCPFWHTSIGRHSHNHSLRRCSSLRGCSCIRSF